MSTASPINMLLSLDLDGDISKTGIGSQSLFWSTLSVCLFIDLFVLLSGQYLLSVFVYRE